MKLERKNQTTIRLTDDNLTWLNEQELSQSETVNGLIKYARENNLKVRSELYVDSVGNSERD